MQLRIVHCSILVLNSEQETPEREGSAFMSLRHGCHQLILSIPYTPRGHVQCSLVLPPSMGQRVTPGLPTCCYNNNTVSSGPLGEHRGCQSQQDPNPVSGGPGKSFLGEMMYKWRPGLSVLTMYRCCVRAGLCTMKK